MMSFTIAAMNDNARFAEVLSLDADLHAALLWNTERSDEAIIAEQEHIMSRIELQAQSCHDNGMGNAPNGSGVVVQSSRKYQKECVAPPCCSWVMKLCMVIMMLPTFSDGVLCLLVNCLALEMAKLTASPSPWQQKR